MTACGLVMVVVLHGKKVFRYPAATGNGDGLNYK